VAKAKVYRFCYIDFEFNNIVHENVNLVCCSVKEEGQPVVNFWLHKDPKAQKALALYLKQFTHFIAYSAIAEARSFLSLGLNPLDFQWIDLFLEYRCLTNHNDSLQWGEQLVEGIVKRVSKPKPKWEREEGDDSNSFKATHSLAEATFKLTGKVRDTEHKTKMRDLIISAPDLFNEDEKNSIMAYCAEDVEFLPEIQDAVMEQYSKLDENLDDTLLFSEMVERGRYAAHTAIMENRGYPINYEKTKNFSDSVSLILYDCQRDINKQFPQMKPFKWDKANGRFKWDQKITRDWISRRYTKDQWRLTDGGKSGNKDYSLSLEAFERFFDFDHDYPRDNFGAQMVRYLKLKQSIYGFAVSPDKKKKTFWDFVGPDKMVRPYTNIYGSQSSRSQPSSTGFMFLKPAWMRALVEPPPGKLMAGIDYGSEEFFISALVAGDQNMIDSYLSGDVYLAFAKLAGMVPPEGTKETHKKERNLAKSTVLGISYLMSKYGLAIKLSGDSGEEWTEDDAEEMISAFYEAYPDLDEYQKQVLEEYAESGYLKTPCGWYLWGDNENFRSVTNFPIQGFGASVMRKAVDLAVAKGVDVVLTLHDALYIIFDEGDYNKLNLLAEAMTEAFAFYFPEPLKETARKIKLDPFIWGPSMPAPTFNKKGEPVFEEVDIGGVLGEVAVSNLYIDDRSMSDYHNFSKYFNKRAESEL
jgi:DNA polymerase family A